MTATAKHPEPLRPDICVVGAGSGGLSVAAGAAAFGVEVVLVERGRMGGDCLNYGCVPSKSVIAAARHAQAIREAAAFGIDGGPPRVDFARVRQHIRGVIDAIAPNDSVARFTGLGVRVIEAEARFVDRDTIVAGGIAIRPRRFVIASGSSPAIPAIEGIDEVAYLTNETVFDLDELPRHLAVLGGGPIGLELAGAFRRLGAAVTVIESGQCLAKEDPELAAVVLRRLDAEGVDLRSNTKAVRLRQAGAHAVAIDLEAAGGGRQTLEASHILVAAGRRANTSDLQLEAAGVRHDASGIAVDARLRTSNPRAFAIGDVAGGAQFTHLANAQAGIALRQILFRLPARFDGSKLPRVTFTDPPLGQVGPTEAEARSGGLRVETVRFPYARLDRAEAEHRTEGLVKLVVARRGRLVGAGIVGAGADELANLFSLAISQRMTLRDLAGFVSPYPTFGEIGKRAATAYYSRYAESGFVRGLIGMLARFG